MKYKIINKVVTKLVCDGIINENDIEIYQYGLQQCLVTVFNILCTFAIGILFSMVRESIFFLLVFRQLRIYVGGYHAKTQLRCHVYSVLLIVIAMGVVKNYQFDIFRTIPLVFICAFIIGIVAPVESKNNFLSNAEKKKYKKKSIMVLGIELGILFLMIILKKIVFAKIIMINVWVIALLGVLGKNK